MKTSDGGQAGSRLPRDITRKTPRESERLS